MSHVDDGLDDGLVIGALGQILNERLINFQDIYR